MLRRRRRIQASFVNVKHQSKSISRPFAVKLWLLNHGKSRRRSPHGWRKMLLCRRSPLVLVCCTPSASRTSSSVENSTRTCSICPRNVIERWFNVISTRRPFWRINVSKRKQVCPACDRSYSRRSILLKEISVGCSRYVDQLIDEMNRDTSFSPSLKKSDSFQSPSVQTFASRSINRSETSSQRRSKTPQPMASSHSTIITKHPSMERINRLAQPKGHRFHSASHVRSTLPENLTSQDLFGNLDDGRHHRQRPSNAEKPKITSEDHRFHELVRSFSDVHQRALSQSPTVNSIVQANPSLQTDREQRIINRRLLLSRSTNRHRLLPQFYNKTHTQWIDISAWDVCCDRNKVFASIAWDERQCVGLDAVIYFFSNDRDRERTENERRNTNES